jgi:prepilin-type N-terminal cleavage/methylation domain-containing protein
MRDRQSGFTLIEMMVTVAVISILATIALPSFFSESRKTKAISEVQPIFNDLRIRLEQSLQENGRYPDTIGETTFHPTSAPGTTKQPLLPMPTAWSDIKVRISGNDEVYCRYTWATGPALDGANIGDIAKTLPPDGFGFGRKADGTDLPPATEWYYLLAKCDMDGDPAKLSYYFSSSLDPTIQRLNEGF